MMNSQFLIFSAVAMTLGVAFVNGFTDAPNAIASVVVTRTLKLKTAVLFAAFADLIGALIMGLLSGKVTQTLLNIVSFGNDSKTAVISIFSAMLSVVIWATAAWLLGIPTSESHALVAGLSGASIAANGSFAGIYFIEWKKVFYGLIVSTLAGVLAGYLFSRITKMFFSNIKKNKADSFFKYSQIISSLIMSFMHGAQDSQKFAGVLIMIMSASRINSSGMQIPSLIISSLIIALGTVTGGGRIIKSVGMDMLKLRRDQGFSADVAGSVCLLISTLSGFPVSTTHTKTSAIIGVGVADSIKSVDWRIAGKMIAAWILTFPACGLLGWITASILFKFLS